MSLGNEFQVCLPSNVQGHDDNVPGKYQTTLARPLELGGSWECALIDITYPHTWVNLNNEYVVVISAMYLATEPGISTPLVANDKNRELIRSLDEVRNCEVLEARKSTYRKSLGRTVTKIDRQTICYTPKVSFTVVPGQYDLKSLIGLLQKHIREVGSGCENTIVAFSSDRNRVKISENMRKMLISCYKKNSLFKLLGFRNQTGNNSNDIDDLLSDEPLAEIEYLAVDAVEPIEAELTPLLKPITSIFLYSNFTNYVLVGNTQTPLLGYFPVQTSWGEQGYWSFNPPYYVPVKESQIHTIEMRLCTDTGDDIQFESGNVICRLNFRRVGMLRGIV